MTKNVKEKGLHPFWYIFLGSVGSLLITIVLAFAFIVVFPIKLKIVDESTIQYNTDYLSTVVTTLTFLITLVIGIFAIGMPLIFNTNVLLPFKEQKLELNSLKEGVKEYVETKTSEKLESYLKVKLSVFLDKLVREEPDERLNAIAGISYFHSLFDLPDETLQRLVEILYSNSLNPDESSYLTSVLAYKKSEILSGWFKFLARKPHLHANDRNSVIRFFWRMGFNTHIDSVVDILNNSKEDVQHYIEILSILAVLAKRLEPQERTSFFLSLFNNDNIVNALKDKTLQTFYQRASVDPDFLNEFLITKTEYENTELHKKIMEIREHQ